MAKGIVASGLAPSSLDTADKVAVAILTGAEAGLSPMMSVRSLYVIKGAPAWISKAARALIQASGKLEPGTVIEEGVRHVAACPAMEDGKRCLDLCEGYCRTHRKGAATTREHVFSVADAKQAGLWKKSGPWQEYPTRMLMHRAAGFHFDDCYSDVLMGLTTVDVLQDYPQAAFIKEGETVATYSEAPGKDPLLAPVVVVPEESSTDAHVEPADSQEPTAEAATHDATKAPDSSADLTGEAGSTPDEVPPGRTAPEEAPVSPDPAKPKRKRTRKPKAEPKAEEPPAPDKEVCEAQGCGHEINLGLEMSWPTPTGRRCADCGPAPKGK
jgi:hypothetical protein